MLSRRFIRSRSIFTLASSIRTPSIRCPFTQTLVARHMAVITDKLESLGDSITSAVLLSWNKENGDSIKEDDVIAVVETDKVTMEIRAKKAGVFLEGLVAKGSEVQVGSDLFKFDDSVQEVPLHAEATIAVSTSPVEAAKTDVKRVEVAVPAMGDSITQGVLVKWLVHPGDFVELDQVITTIETDKVTVEVRSPHAGKFLESFAAESDEVTVGSPLFAILEGDVSTKLAAAASKPVTAPTPIATPAETKKKAEETKKVSEKQHVETKSSSPLTTTTSVNKEDRLETRVKMTRMRIRIAQRLKESQNTAAMLTTFQEVDMGNLIEMRQRHKDDFEKIHGVKLGFMSAFVKASTAALIELPAVNAIIDDNTNEIVFRNYCDISVAVASPTGLVVPVLRNTEKMSFADVEKAIGAYGKKAKDGALALEDMAGGTFTISNGGVFGSLFGTPIINPPQSAILGMHATKIRPMVTKDGKIEARPMMYLALTYDHRLIDGREAVTFLKIIQSKIEDPTKLLLEV